MQKKVINKFISLKEILMQKKGWSISRLVILQNSLEYSIVITSILFKRISSNLKNLGWQLSYGLYKV